MSDARYSMHTVLAEGYKSMRDLQQSSELAGLPRPLLELVKMRASQLNHCAYCLDMHAKDAVALGVPAEKLFVLEGWREAPFYSAREQAALAWTEALTLIADRGVPDDLYRETREHFSERELACLTMAIVTINGWNRIAISTRMEPGHYQSRFRPDAAV
ncbi:MAG TPA: carboxymuconolactone decarboxylase family protein [Chloroflexota bacterium]|nr:carboxymuconolactone decarboxylase family protein [Chloroflexota bacterium]